MPVVKRERTDLKYIMFLETFTGYIHKGQEMILEKVHQQKRVLEVRKQVTNNTNHYENSDTRKEENVAPSLKKVIEFKILKKLGPVSFV